MAKITHRSEKRVLGMTSPAYRVYEAFCLGQAFAHDPTSLPPRLRRNPYPPGRRHAEWDRGDEATKKDKDAGR